MRHSGLDIFRSIAILLVVGAHNFFPIPFVSAFGQRGVDFFFALSGFLIGKIIIRALNQYSDFRWIPTFLYRRWLKTLPLYYLVLFFKGFVYGFPRDFGLYIFQLRGFFQWKDPVFYSASWTLFIEEFFYISCALCAFVFYLKKIKVSPAALFKFCFLIILIATAYRVIFCLFFQEDSQIQHMTIANLIIPRLDAPIFGFILAIVKSYYPYLFQKLENNRGIILFSSIVIVLCTTLMMPYIIEIILLSILVFSLNALLGGSLVYFVMKNVFKMPPLDKKIIFYMLSFFVAIVLSVDLFNEYLTYFSIWGFTLDGFLSASILLYFVTMPELNPAGRTRSVFLFISQSSYAVYLTHELVIHFCFSFVNGAPKDLDFMPLLSLSILSVFLTYLLCYFLLSFIEKPILAWRDRKFTLAI